MATESDEFPTSAAPPKRHSSFLASSTATTPFISDDDAYAYPHRKSTSASAATSTFQFPASSSSGVTGSTPSSPTKREVLPLRQPPPPVKPNAHPYAIKTTSGGLLSRSHSNASSVHYRGNHRYVPTPGSPTKSRENSEVGEGKKGDAYRDHRFSQSLTEVSGTPVPQTGPPPRPLPVPPASEEPLTPSSTGRSMSASPSKSSRFTELQAEFTSEDVSSRQPRTKRAETMPGGMNAPTPFTFPSRGDSGSVPEDPKLWTPAQLASYLRAEGGDALADTVLEKQMNGRAFLHLANSSSEVDPDLREASRTLRQASLRGAIWGFDPSSQRGRSDSASSSSSLSDANSTSSNNVREMIASLERSTSKKRKTSVRSSRKEQRSMPRGKVNDIFNSDNYDDNPTIKAHGNVQPRQPDFTFPQTQTKELPRLLPLPPTLTGGSTTGIIPAIVPPTFTGGSTTSVFSPNGILSPMSTGIGITGLMLSSPPRPNNGAPHLLLQPMTTGSLNAEFGFRGSPGTRRSEKAANRMLPLPPTTPALPPPPLLLHATGDASVLHHPRPQRGANAVHDLVSQQEEDQGSDNGDQSELTMEELLAREEERDLQESGVRRGVKVWEMDEEGLEGTVKKVTVSPTRPTPRSDEESDENTATSLSDESNRHSPDNRSFTPDRSKEYYDYERHQPQQEYSSLLSEMNASGADLSFVNHRSGRRARGVRPKAASRNPAGARSIESPSNSGTTSRRTSTASFKTCNSSGTSEEEGSIVGAGGDSGSGSGSGDGEAISVQAGSVFGSTRGTKQSVRRKSGKGILSLFAPPTPLGEEPPPSLLRRDGSLSENARVAKMQKAVEERERAVEDRERDVESRVEEVERRTSVLDLRERDLSESAFNLSQEADALAEEKERLNGTRATLDERESALDAREAAVAARERDVENRAREVQEREEAVNTREASITAREQTLHQTETASNAREANLQSTASTLAALESTLKAKEDGLKAREERLREAEKAINVKEREIASLLRRTQHDVSSATPQQRTVPELRVPSSSQEGGGADEATSVLAARLCKRVLGERLGGYLFSPYVPADEGRRGPGFRRRPRVSSATLVNEDDEEEFEEEEEEEGEGRVDGGTGEGDTVMIRRITHQHRRRVSFPLNLVMRDDDAEGTAGTGSGSRGGNRGGGGGGRGGELTPYSYLMLLGIGVFALALRVLLRKASSAGGAGFLSGSAGQGLRGGVAAGLRR